MFLVYASTINNISFWIQLSEAFIFSMCLKNKKSHFVFLQQKVFYPVENQKTNSWNFGKSLHLMMVRLPFILRGSRVNYFYRKIHKFKDGKILLRNNQLKVVDVATQKCFKGTDLNSYFYVVTEQYVASIGHDASVYVSKIYKDDE